MAGVFKDDSSSSSGVMPPAAADAAHAAQRPAPMMRPTRKIIPSRRAGTQREPPQDNRAVDMRRLSSAAIPTTVILTEFPGSITQMLDPEQQERQKQWERSVRKARATVWRLQHPSVAARLKQELNGVFRVNSGDLGPLKRYWGHADVDLIDACNTYLPDLGAIPVYIRDFSNDSGVSQRIDMHKLQDFKFEAIKQMHEKPADVKVRWIHIPIGVGILQSTIEELFNYSGSQKMGKPFSHTGGFDFPFPTVSMLSFYNREWYNETIEAFNALSHADELKKSKGHEHMSPLIRADLEWRANHVGAPVNFWDISKANLPYPLVAQITGHHGPLSRKGDLLSQQEPQALAMHPHFENSMLAVNLLRMFHRNDGFLITFSNSPGVDYLGKHLDDCLKQATYLRGENSEVNAIAHAGDAFLQTGTKMWRWATVEWLMVYLITEAAVTPHNIRQGRTCVSLTEAYNGISSILRQMQNAPWKRGESVRLVKTYHNCLDELRVIKAFTANKAQALRSMLIDVAQIEAEYRAEGIDETEEYEYEDVIDGQLVTRTRKAESMADRVKWAVKLLEDEEKHADVLIEGFEKANKAVFRLQSMEQNDRQIAADSQNEAIMLFTFVTIIFLPLSFFTSYYGMNLQGIGDTDKDQTWFWQVFGPIGILLIVVTALYAYRKDARAYLAVRGRQTWRLALGWMGALVGKVRGHQGDPAGEKECVD